MNNIDIKKLADDGQVFSEVLMDSPNKIGDLVLMNSEGKKFFLDIHHFFKITSDYQIEGVVGKINEDGSCRMYTTFDLAKMAECDYDLETFRLHYQLLGM